MSRLSATAQGEDPLSIESRRMRADHGSTGTLPRGVVADGYFERLYTNYERNVFRYTLAVLGQQADAEDVTQTTFLNAYRALQRGERPENPERWLITIAHNACRQRYRNAQRRPREVALDERVAIAVEDDHTTTAAELQRAMLQLPPAQRSALVLRELEGRSYAETAAALHISNSALETLLFRARRTLREQLEGDVSCTDAAAAIEMQLDGRLPLSGRRVLRAHLRSCEECSTLARSLRAQRKTLRGLPAFSFPAWIGRLLGGGSGAGAGASVGGFGAAGLALKVAAVVAVGAVVGGGVVEGATHLGPLTGLRNGQRVSHDRPPISARPSPASGTLPVGQTAQTINAPGSGQTLASRSADRYRIHRPGCHRAARRHIARQSFRPRLPTRVRARTTEAPPAW